MMICEHTWTGAMCWRPTCPSGRFTWLLAVIGCVAVAGIVLAGLSLG